jgi:hypothetical protein
MLDLRKKASFFQGIGPNPLFACKEQVFKDNFMHYMALGRDIVNLYLKRENFMVNIL